jgi:hypothetical protein
MALASPKKKQEQAKQFRINPEVDAKLNAFMEAEPDLVRSVKDLPRDQLERKFLLRKMNEVEWRKDWRKNYIPKIKAWVEDPKNADAVKTIKVTVNSKMKPEEQERALLTQAWNYIHNTGIKLS